MNLSALGLAILESLEELKLVAYQDPGGVWTNGFGHTGPEVTEGSTCTVDQASQWLTEDCGHAEAGVSRLVKVALTQRQFDALTLFAYNCGVGALGGSTLLTLLNSPHPIVMVADQFLPWNKIHGTPSTMLTKRRRLERALFLDGLT